MLLVRELVRAGCKLNLGGGPHQPGSHQSESGSTTLVAYEEMCEVSESPAYQSLLSGGQVDRWAGEQWSGERWAGE